MTEPEIPPTAADTERPGEDGATTAAEPAADAAGPTVALRPAVSDPDEPAPAKAAWASRRARSDDQPTARIPAQATPSGDEGTPKPKTTRTRTKATKTLVETPRPETPDAGTPDAGTPAADTPTAVTDKDATDKDAAGTKADTKADTKTDTKADTKADTKIDVVAVGEPGPRHAAAAPRAGRLLTVTFGILMVLFLAGTAAMTALYVDETHAYQKQAQLASDRNSAIAARDAQITEAKTQLQTAQAQAANLQTQLATAQSQLVQVQGQKTVIAKCLDDLHKFFIAENANAADSTLTSLYNTAQASCDEADKYISS